MNTTSTSVDLRGVYENEQGDPIQDWSFGKVKEEVLLLPFFNFMVITINYTLLSEDELRALPLYFKRRSGPRV